MKQSAMMSRLNSIYHPVKKRNYLPIILLAGAVVLFIVADTMICNAYGVSVLSR